MTKTKTGKVEDMLRELGKKIDVLIDEAKVAKDDIRDDIEEKVKDLKTKKDKIEEDISNYKKDENFKDAKSHFSAAFTELKQAMEALIHTVRK